MKLIHFYRRVSQLVMHKIYNPGFLGLCPIDHFNCNSMSSLKFENSCCADMLMKLHPYWKHYVMIYDVEELLLCLKYFYPSNNKMEKHLIFLIWRKKASSNFTYIWYIPHVLFLTAISRALHFYEGIWLQYIVLGSFKRILITFSALSTVF